MAILPIYNCSNPVLKQKTMQIEQINSEIKNLAMDMFDTMRNTGNGVGLAANQVGKNLALVVIDLSGVEEYDGKGMDELVLVNPQIIDFSEETNLYYEGCLSVPGFYEDVERPTEVKVKYLNLDEQEIKLDCSDFLARVVQHEIDHLNGILFYEKLSVLKRTLSKNKIKAIVAGDYSVNYEMIDANNLLHQN